MTLRRILAFAFGLAGVSGCATQLPAPSRAPSAWSQFRLNAANNVVIPGNLRTAWSVESGGPISASPSLVGGILYLGNNKGHLVALDVASGARRWQHKVSNALMSAPLVVGRDVIVGEGDESTVVEHGVVHVGSSGVNALLAFDRDTGAVRWSTTLSGTAMPSPAYINGRILQHNGDGNLVELAPEDGSVAFAHNLGTIPSMVALLPLGNDVMVSAGQTKTQIVAFHASTGGVIWRAPFTVDSGLGDGPLVSDGTRILGDYLAPAPGAPYVKAGVVNEQRAFALDQKTGARLWDVHLENGVVPRRNQSAIPLLDRGIVFVGSAIAPVVHAIDATTGRVLWRRRVRGTVKGGLVAVNGNIYFGDFSGRLWSLRERDGSIVGTANVGTPFNVGSPIVVGQTLVIGSFTGRILALPLGTLDDSVDVAAPKSIASRWVAPKILDRFRFGDRNHDGTLSPSELSKVLAYEPFSRVDRNGNGKVTPLEFGMAYAAATTAAYLRGKSQP